MSFIPSGTGDDEPEEAVARRKKEVRKGVEVFGAGMERGVEEAKGEMSESERSGRKQRRKGMRSGSKNVFRQMGS
jgi:ribosome biogenesis protein ENP2